MKNIDDYKSNAENQWCPGCSNYGILEAFKSALVELGKKPQEVCLVSGIGQAAKLPHYLKCNFFNGLHGRAIPVATGIKIANPELTTIVVTGDGDCYGEGGNHFIHALRRNPDITVVVHNNEIYALTKGQASPTTPFGEVRSLQIKGVDVPPLNMPAIAIQQRCGFVARGFAGDVSHLKNILVRGIRHEGLSYIDIIQPCITWGKKPLQWYKDRISIMDEEHDLGDRKEALRQIEITGEKISVGVIYEEPSGNVFGEKFKKAINEGPLAGLKHIKKSEIRDMLNEFIATS